MIGQEIMVLSRADDGTLCEITVEAGRRKTTIYRRDASDWIPETAAMKDAFHSHGLCTMMRAIRRGNMSLDAHNAFRLLLFGYCYLQHLCYLLILLWPLNPHWPPVSSSAWLLKPAIAPVALLPAPARVIRGCQDEDFCRLVSVLPVINTTYGPIYPNFTRGPDGVPTDYRQALRRVASLLANQSCTEISLDSGTANDTALRDLREAVGLWIYAFDQRCHPEVVTAATGFIDPNEYGGVVAQVRTFLKPVPCDLSWEDVYNSTYHDQFGPGRGCGGGEEVTGPWAIRVSYVEIK
ncbi:ORF27 [Retroperitoneal fibromatosis-associated herpesvirus]|uniref:ORF27 n=1 Tax=Retroperitoneal fibromatosis-associated herpesvirus TaxID=111469 RepID=U5NID2_9GAMA|nr:ORF27 [Retroperitoneal fibromatosis-associated herpesvirus]AGY30710.1 ORF27 [Retroperitoneal fibromatosis-associated herpesvirus]